MTLPDRHRRRFLAACGKGAACAAAWPVLHGLGGCGGAGETGAPASLAVPLAELPEGARVRRLLGDTPLELQRLGERVVARSLLCTHQGCEVEWAPEEEQYFCPCHDGVFAADGRVLGGPPTRPLRSYTVRVQDQLAIIGE